MPRTRKSDNDATDSPKPRRPRRGNGATDNMDADAVAKLAYEIYQSRGGTHGADLDDWLKAERQLKGVSADVTGPPPAKARKRKASEETGL
jgi:Protein of unknown function (DUF2934)